MKIVQGGTMFHGGLFVADKTLDQLRVEANSQDIHVWPSDGPRFPGDDALFRYKRGSIEVGNLLCDTEYAALKYLLGR